MGQILRATSPDTGQSWEHKLDVDPAQVPHYIHNQHLPIFFYGGDFSSFAPYRFRAPMLFDDPDRPLYPTYWRTREHWYQAHKAQENVGVCEAIAAEEDTWQAKQMGNSKTLFTLPQDWDGLRSYLVMLEGIRIQLDRFPRLREALAQTGDRFIAEISPRDEIWGYVIDDDGQLRGTNLLGACWMAAREEIS